jgi:hypothetical protein
MVLRQPQLFFGKCAKHLFRPYAATALFVWNSYAAPFILKPK